MSLAFAQDEELYTVQKTSTRLSELIIELEEQYALNFSYATERIGDMAVAMDVVDGTLSQVLDAMFGNTTLEYRIIDHEILVRNQVSETQSDEDLPFILEGKILGQFGKPLEAATIFVEGTNLGAYSDQAGKFELEIPSNYSDKLLKVKYLGYDDQSYLIQHLRDSVFITQLTPSFLEIAELVIENEVKPIKTIKSPQAIIWESENPITATSLGGSFFHRSLQMLPGVSGINDASTDIKIRGSGSDQTLLLLDGMPIYHSDHYFGVFSALNTSFIGDVSLYRNTLSMEYGGRSSGMVDIASTDCKQDIGAELEVDLHLVGLKLDVPLSSRTKVLLAGRTTHRNINNSQFNSVAPKRENTFKPNNTTLRKVDFQSDPSFAFNDLNAKVYHTFSDRSSLAFHLFSSNDQLKNDLDGRIGVNKNRFHTYTQRDNVSWRNRSISTIYKYRGKVLSYKGTAFYSGYSHENKQQYSLDFVQKNKDDLDLGIDVNDGIKHSGFRNVFSLPLRQDSLDLILEFADYQVDYQFEYDKVSQLDEAIGSKEMSVAINYRLLHFDNFELTTNLRTSYFDHAKKWYWSPQIFASYLSDGWLFKSSYGKYPQVVRELSFDLLGVNHSVWTMGQYEDIPVLQSNNYMLGLTFFNDKLTLDIEGYYKDMTGVLEYVPIYPAKPTVDLSERSYKLFEGDGRTFGLDVLLTTNIGRYRTTMAYTLSKLEHRFKEIFRNEYYAPEDDRRHQFKWSNSYNWSHWNAGVDVVLASGRNYLDLGRIGRDGNILERGIIFNKLPAYQRVDIGLKYLNKIYSKDFSIGFSIINVLNAKNVSYQQSIVSKSISTDRVLNGLISNQNFLLRRTFNVSTRLTL